MFINISEFFYPCCSPLSALEGTPRNLVATGDQEGAGWAYPPLMQPLVQLMALAELSSGSGFEIL